MDDDNPDNKRNHLQEALENPPQCYVLITCGEPAEDGQMQVKMTYQGDDDLATYLLQGAQDYIENEKEDKDFG